MILKHPSSRLGRAASLIAVAPVVVAMGTATSTIALAQGSGGLEEIVVTAQRREESLQKVPISVLAFSTSELERRNIVSTRDLVSYVPNLIGHNNTGLGTANTYYIRGSGNTESLASQDPPVGTYIDDIYISRQSANDVALFDVERVEVLRGPQGTLFGRNTTGGAVSVIMARPAQAFGGFAEATYGRFDKVGLRGSVDVPFSEALSAKISAYGKNDRGYVRNTTTGERLNQDKGWGVRGAIAATVSDAVSWNLSALHTHSDALNLLNFTCNPANEADCKGRFVTTGLRKNNQRSNQFPTLALANEKGRLPLGAETDFTLLASNLEARFSAVTINAITGYTDIRQDYLIDFFDGRTAPSVTFATDPVTGRPTLANVANNVVAVTPVRRFATGGFVIANRAKSDQFSQEVKASGALLDDRFRYVGGIYYLRENNFTDFADIITTTGAPLLLADRTLDNTTEAIAGYIQADYSLTEQVKLTAGVRYTDEKRRYSFADNRATCQVTPLPATCIANANFVNVDVDANPATPGVTIPLRQQAKIWTPRFVVNYEPSEDVLLFASATRGFKSGAQSARGTVIRTLLPTTPEKVWAYELGAKTEFLDRRVRFNVTGFIQNTTDLQSGSASVNALTGALSFTTRNFAGLRNKGVEVEIQALPVENLILSLTAGFQDAKYTLNRDLPALDQFNVLSVGAQQAECLAALAGQASPRGDARTATARAASSCGNGIVGFNGALTEPVRTPKVTIAAGVSYTHDLAAWDLRVIPSVNVIYTSKQEVGTTNLSFYRSATGAFNVTGDGTFLAGSFSKAHTYVNASVAVETADNAWRVTADCSNCFGVDSVQATLSNFSYINPPGTWSVRVRRKF